MDLIIRVLEEWGRKFDALLDAGNPKMILHLDASAHGLNASIETAYGRAELASIEYAPGEVWYQNRAVSAQGFGCMCSRFLDYVILQEGAAAARVTLQTALVEYAARAILAKNPEEKRECVAVKRCIGRRLQHVPRGCHLSIQETAALAGFEYHGCRLLPAVDVYRSGHPESNALTAALAECAARFS